MRRFASADAALRLRSGKVVTTASLPSETKAATETQSTSALENTAAEPDADEKDFHLELQRRVPEGINSITACMTSDDTIIAGGPSDSGPQLVCFPMEGEKTRTLDVPEDTDYLYALCDDPDGGFFLLSGSLPAGYVDARGNFKFLTGDPEGRLTLSRYDKDFNLQQTIPLETRYTETGARFFQITKVDGGFAILSASMLVLLDERGAETTRQELNSNDGWAFAAMQKVDGTLFVLAQDMFGGDASELRAFDAKTLTALEVQTLPSGTLGLGLDENGTFLLTDSDALLSFDLTTGKVQTIALWRELGAKTNASHAFRTKNGYVLFSPNEEAVSLVLWKASTTNVKKVLTLAIAADCPVWYEFTQLFETFNLSQNDYRIDYTVYSDSPYGDGEPLDVLRTQIMAGDSPDLFAFYSDGNQAPPLEPRAVCADVRPLLPDVTETALLPGLFDLLTQDDALYALPLTVRVDTLIMPSNLIDYPGVTLPDLETAREKMSDDWVAVDSWNTPKNLFALTAAFCIGRFTDRENGTCNFETQEFYDLLDWCKRWGGNGSTPETPEKPFSSADGSRASAGFPGARTSRKSGLTARAIPTQAIRSAPAAVRIWS